MNLGSPVYVIAVYVDGAVAPLRARRSFEILVGYLWLLSLALDGASVNTMLIPRRVERAE